jgi:hypothetical protein
MTYKRSNFPYIKVVCVAMYLDDGSGIEKNDELCKAVVKQVKCGFVPKVEKSLWKPTKRLIWLGTLSIVRQDFIKFLIRELTRFKMSSHQISNVTNN